MSAIILGSKLDSTHYFVDIAACIEKLEEAVADGIDCSSSTTPSSVSYKQDAWPTDKEWLAINSFFL